MISKPVSPPKTHRGLHLVLAIGQFVGTLAIVKAVHMVTIALLLRVIEQYQGYHQASVDSIVDRISQASMSGPTD